MGLISLTQMEETNGMPIRKGALLINLLARNQIPFNFHPTWKLYGKNSLSKLYHTPLDMETYSKL